MNAIPESETRKLMNVRRRLTSEERGRVHALMLKDSRVKQAQSTSACSRCSGSGRIPCYNHVASGVCFKCGGSGK